MDRTSFALNQWRGGRVPFPGMPGMNSIGREGLLLQPQGPAFATTQHAAEASSKFDLGLPSVGGTSALPADEFDATPRSSLIAHPHPYTPRGPFPPLLSSAPHLSAPSVSFGNAVSPPLPPPLPPLPPAQSSSTVVPPAWGPTPFPPFYALLPHSSAQHDPSNPEFSRDVSNLAREQRRSGDERAGSKRIGEAGDPSQVKRKKVKVVKAGPEVQKTKLLLNPPPLPQVLSTPDPSLGYTSKQIPTENFYLPRFTHGTTAQTRLAFCSFCGLADLATRKSEYGYHLLHAHNVGPHAPFFLPAPNELRDARGKERLKEENAYRLGAHRIEARCLFDGQDGRGECASGAEGEVGRWHKLNAWRESMNAHLGGRGLKDEL